VVVKVVDRGGYLRVRYVVLLAARSDGDAGHMSAETTKLWPIAVDLSIINSTLALLALTSPRTAAPEPAAQNTERPATPSGWPAIIEAKREFGANAAAVRRPGEQAWLSVSRADRAIRYRGRRHGAIRRTPPQTRPSGALRAVLAHPG
jgi:hypothetical protein